MTKINKLTQAAKSSLLLEKYETRVLKTPSECLGLFGYQFQLGFVISFDIVT